MIPFIYDETLSKISNIELGLSLRFSYVFAEEFGCGGKTAHPVFMEKLWSTSKIEHVVKMVNKNMDRLSEEEQAILVDAYKMYKDLLAIKNKPQQVIVAIKKTESVYRTLFDKLTLIIKKVYSDVGIFALGEQSDIKTVLQYYETTLDSSERNPTNSILKPSSIAALKHVNLATPNQEGAFTGEELFLLSDSFFKKPFADNYLEASIENIGTSAQHDKPVVYLASCFNIKGLLALNGNELSFLRKELLNATKGLRASVDEWLKLCYQEEQDFNEIATVFKDSIVPQAKELDHVIASIKQISLNDFETAVNVITLEVGFGLVPLTLLWQYFKDYQIILPPTWQVLEPLIPQYKNTYYPVIFYKSTMFTRREARLAQQNEVAPPPKAKKSISID